MTHAPLWHRAAAFAAQAHRHQRRRDGSPYSAHPARVALTIATVFGVHDDEVLAAAMLHDVIEDCDVDYDEVLKHFGKRTADLVAAMTKDMRQVESDRERDYDAQLAAAPPEARLIKLADVLDNALDSATLKDQASYVDKVRRILALTERDETLAEARRPLAALLAAWNS